jgi:hypothetical protein
MKITFKLIFFVTLVYVSQFVSISPTSAELIEPTRNLGGETEAMSRLTVLSEPPGLKVVLDGNSLGKTPAFLVEVKPGLHVLKVQDAETEIFLEPGKVLKISLFKDEFVQIPVDAEKLVEKPEKPEQKEKPFAPETAKPSPEEIRKKENTEQAKERWQRFVDGSSPIF